MDSRKPREEVLIEWFLGDSKEILADLQGAVAAAHQVGQQAVAVADVLRRPADRRDHG